LLGMPAAEQGLRARQSLMDDCVRMNHGMMQWLTQSLTPWTIDGAVGDMQLDSASGPKLATFVRYNVLLEPKWLSTEVEVAYEANQIEKIAQMDDPTNMNDLARIGQKAAVKQVKPEHFPTRFDVA